MEATQEAPARAEFVMLERELLEHVREMLAEHLANQQKPSLAELYTALATAQGEITAAELTRENPHLKNRYATLAAVWDACRKPLSKNGLCLQQFPSFDGARVSVRTVLAHKSGQEIESTLTLAPQQLSIQGVGSAITYARRYSMSAMVGVCPDDDDDGTLAGKGEPARQASAPKVPDNPPRSTRQKPTQAPQEPEQAPAGAKAGQSAQKGKQAPQGSTTGAPPTDDAAEARKAFWSCVTSVDGVLLEGSSDMDKDATRAAVVRRLHALEVGEKIPSAPVSLGETSEQLQAWLASYQAGEVQAIIAAYREHARVEREAEEAGDAAFASPAEQVVDGMFAGLPT